MTESGERERILEDRLSGIEEISRALSSSLDIEVLLPRLMDRVTAIMRCERSTLFLLDAETGELWSKVFQGEEAVTVRLPPGKGIAGEAAQTGKSINIDDAYSHPGFLPDIDRLTGYRTRSLLTVPLRSIGGEITGAAQVLNRRDGKPFDDDDRSLLEALSSQISLALQTSWLYSTVVRHNRELDILNEIEREISRLRDPEAAIDRVLAKAIDALECEAGSILLVREDDRGKLYFRTALGERGEALKGYNISLGQGIVGWAAEHGRAALVNDVSADARFDPSLSEMIEFPARQVLAVPLRSDGEVIGAVELLNRRGGEPFAEEDGRFLNFIGIQITKALQEACEAREREQRERLATVGKMLAGVLHDLKNPITVITSCADFLQTERDDGRRRDLSARILRQLDILRKMTEDLMAFARGESSVYIRKVYMHLFMGELEELVAAEAAGHPVQVLWERGYEGAAFFDPDSIRRSLLNMARNAIEVMADGGRLTISTSCEGDRLIFKVADTGPGIPPQIRSTLFDAFVTSGKEDGTGLGLAVVKQAVLDHDGTIEFETESGTGTTFTIRLPLTRPVSPAS